MKIIKKLFIAVLCAAMLTASGIPASAAAAPSEWAQDYVRAEIDRGYVPQHIQYDYTRPITRAEFCALTVNLYESVFRSEIEGRETFTDTDDIYVEKAAYIGLVQGVGGGRFDPDSNLTREMAAVLLARLADAIGEPLPHEEALFGDIGEASYWALEAIGSISAAGIMNGTGNNMFSPKEPYTREQSIVTMGRLIEIVINGMEFVPEYHVLDNATVQYIRTQYTGLVTSPAVIVIKSPGELEKYIADSFGYRRDGVMYHAESDFTYAAEKYGDDFFAKNYLVFVVISEHSGSNRHEVESITASGDIIINRIVPEIGTSDMAQWHIIIELDANFAPEQFNVALLPVEPPFAAPPQGSLPVREPQ